MDVGVEGMLARSREGGVIEIGLGATAVIRGVDCTSSGEDREESESVIVDVADGLETDDATSSGVEMGSGSGSGSGFTTGVGSITGSGSDSTSGSGIGSGSGSRSGSTVMRTGGGGGAGI